MRSSRTLRLAIGKSKRRKPVPRRWIVSVPDDRLERVVLDTNVFVAGRLQSPERVREDRRPEDRYTGTTDRKSFAFIEDPDDRKFAALAHAAGAILISNDDDLLRHRDRLEFPVLTPGEVWKTTRRRRGA